MKPLAAALAASVALLVPGAGALTPGPGQVRLTGKVEAVERAARSTTTTYGLYSASYRGRIGTEVLVCGSRGDSWRVCLDFIRTPRGTLVAQGIVPVSSRFTVLGVLGGTGIYANVGGELTLVADGRTQRIVGDLDAF